MSGSGRYTQLRKIVVVFKTHFDLGFTDLPAAVMARYTGPMFHAMQRVMQSTAREPRHLRYNWTLPAWALKFFLSDPSVPPDTRQAARRLVEDGQLNWHAWPFTTHTAFCSIEELVRGLHISRSLSEEFGRWPSGAKQTDVPGHTWALPSLLAKAGVKFLHLGCNSGSHPPHVPRLFWWEGPDGARLLTWYSPGGYGTPLLPPDDWPYDTWLALQQTVDNHGPHLPEELEQMRLDVEEGAPGVELLFGELGDFAESLLARPEQLATLPVVPYDLADTWIHGIGTMPREVKRVRQLRGRLLELELAALQRDWPLLAGADADFPIARQIAPLLDAAYEQLLLFGEHTWGLDVKSTIKRIYGREFEAARQTEPYRRLEESWAAKAAYVDNAEALYREAARLGRRLDIEPESVSVEWQAVASGAQNVLENSGVRLEVDPERGGIVSLVDKRTGKEWVDRESREPFGGYRYDLYSATDIAEFMRAYGTLFQDWFMQDFGKQGYPEDLAHVTAYARGFHPRKEAAEGRQRLVLSGGRPDSSDSKRLPWQEVAITIELGEDEPFVQLRYDIAAKEATPLAESTAVPFPLNLPGPTFRLSQTGSVIDPARQIVAGASHNLWCVDGWLDASDERVGLGIVPLDMPLVSIGDPSIYRFEPQRVHWEPLVYAHLSNTQWGTNFVQWLEGDFSFTIRLVPHTGTWRSSRLLQGVGPIAGASPPFHLPGNCRLLAVCPRHDGLGAIIRFYETSGEHSQSSIHLGGTVSAVWRCDLMERPVERLSIEREDGVGARVEMDVAPHAVETLLVEFAKEEGSR